ncbi:MAG: DUF202 domain-containing protein [Planctomycetaceae bacterium]
MPDVLLDFEPSEHQHLGKQAVALLKEWFGGSMLRFTDDRGSNAVGVFCREGIGMVLDSANRNDAGDPRVYFAAERTLLAWVRTGLALMGFGFVVARFGLFLREVAAVNAALPPRQQSFSLWIGTTLVVLGVAVNLGAAFRHWHTVQRLEKGLPLRFHPVSLGVIAAVMLGLFGLLLAGYLHFWTA